MEAGLRRDGAGRYLVGWGVHGVRSGRAVVQDLILGILRWMMRQLCSQTRTRGGQVESGSTEVWCGLADCAAGARGGQHLTPTPHLRQLLLGHLQRLAQQGGG